MRYALGSFLRFVRDVQVGGAYLANASRCVVVSGVCDFGSEEDIYDAGLSRVPVLLSFCRLTFRCVFWAGLAFCFAAWAACCVIGMCSTCVLSVESAG